jgi:5-methylcytosine-specific restriction endonuclease McrA
MSLITDNKISKQFNIDLTANKSSDNVEMTSNDATDRSVNKIISSKELKKQRMDELLNSCQDEILKQIIGPFGLTKAMFNDKDGGNVTTTHNFEKGVVATEADKQKYDAYKNSQEKFDRKPYDKDLPQKRKELFKKDGDITSEYTGNKLRKDGSTHLDHVVAAENIERNSKANLFMDQNQRVDMANSKENLVACEGDINQSMGKKDKKDWVDQQRKKDPGKTNGESFGVDKDRLDKVTKKANKHVDKTVRNAQIKKQSVELLQTGAKEAMNNALKQAMGMVFHEVVNSSFIEVKRISNDPLMRENFVDNVLEVFKNTVTKVLAKSEHIFNSVISGGIQGIISNLLTFIINNVVTTASKVVTIIRESMMGIWEAIKLIINPPKDTPKIEIARKATKIILGVVTTGVGLLFEKSVEGFISSIPILLPIASILGTAITAILTGIMGALLMFAVDKFFDWLNDPGTQKLEGQIEHMNASVNMFNKISENMDSQFQTSELYKLCKIENGKILKSLENSKNNLGNTIAMQDNIIENRSMLLSEFTNRIKDFDSIDESDIDNLFLQFQGK